MIVKIQCTHIEAAANVAVANSNDILEVSEGWSKVEQVVYMQKTLSSFVKEEIEKQQPTLRYWASERTPHNLAEEGFICDTCKVGISFPR